MSDSQIHPSAIVDPKARLGAGVVVGPYAIINADVELGDGCRVGHHATIDGPSRIGARNEFFPYAAIGFKTQDLKYRGEPTFLEIGEGNVFREFCTVHRGTAPDEKTIIGDGNLFLAYSHVAHNCIVGNKTIFSNNATIAGHVTVGDHAVISGLSAVHQFCRIGRARHHRRLRQDRAGRAAVPHRRRQSGRAARRQPRRPRAPRLHRQRHQGHPPRLPHARDKTLNFSQAIEKIEASDDASNAHVKELLQFLKTTQRGVIRPEPLAGS